jgi:flagellum-specific ATP synthase
MPAARDRLDDFKPAFGAIRTGRLVGHDGVMLEAEGLDMPLGASARIQAVDGRKMRGEVVGFRGSRTLLVPLDGAAPYRAGSRIEPDAEAGRVACGQALLGRIIGAHGEPLDGRGPILARDSWPLHGPVSNPLNRGRVVRPLDLGVRAVNGLLTAGEGQRIAIIAGSGVGKSVLMGQMLAGSECDVVVIGLVGERAREVTDFIETRLSASMMPRAVVVAVPADHPPLLRLRAAMRATAIAEHFRHEGKRVLLLIDSLTRVAHAQREIGLALGEPPTMKGYPPSALGLIPGLVERAGRDVRSGGSITALYTVLADGGDNDDPIVDTARAIADGHIVLSRALSEQNVFPAIDVGKSLSRVMADIADADHLRAAARFRQLWSTYEDNRDLVLMGAYVSGNDPVLDEAIARRSEMLDYLRQSPHQNVPMGPARSSLVEAFL